MNSPFSKHIGAILFCIALLSSATLKGQSCSFTASTLRVCFGGPVTFTPTFSGGTPVKFEWDFGDTKKDSVQKPSYKYNTTGTFIVNLKITFAGGATCNATPLPVTVLPLPVADLTVESFPVQCFDGNYVCLKDRSQATAAPIKKRTILWGDGGAIQNAPLTQKDFCQSYASIGLFTPVIEVTDTNGCIARKELKDAIKIAEDVYPSFSHYVFEAGCGYKRVGFINNYLTDKSVVKNFWWDFGDGNVIKNMAWDSVTHRFDSAGVFTVRLIYEAYSGCIDTFSTVITNSPKLTFNFTYSVTPRPVCYSDRYSVLFTASYIPGVNYGWVIYNPKGGTPWGISTRTGHLPVSFKGECDTFPFRLYLGKDGCDTMTPMDSLIILGPVADLEISSFKVGNKYQCEADTIYAPPNNYHFSHFCSNSIRFLWDFGDPYAAKCTTDTRSGVNVGMNCNYSRDSINVKHKYKTGVDSCYLLYMYLKDTITGCEDRDSTKIVVGKPSSENIYALKPFCLHYPVYFDLDAAEPLCDKQNVWILPDSACTNKTWYPLFPPYKWTYDFTCNSSGWVTVGFVIQNGKCYDTTWYHNMLYFADFDGGIIVKEERTCDSITLHVSFRDSLQQGIRLVTWDFENGVNIIVDALDTAYGKLPSKSFSYKTPGIKTVVVGIQNDSGCFKYDYRITSWGHYTSFRFDSIVCVGENVIFIDSVRYYQAQTVIDTTPYWHWLQPRPEKLFWNLGDSTTYNGPFPVHSYANPGLYKVRLISQDSFSCQNTVEKIIRVNASKADFGISDTLFVCGQIVKFYDSSFAEFISPPGYPKLDSIVTWTWDFGDGKTQSHLKNPYHDYTSYGVFTIKQIVYNSSGCADSLNRQIRIKGPQPSFEVTGDTIGCVPFTAGFKNTSVDTKYWVWNYGDSSVYSSEVFENTQHTYTRPGVYDVWIYGVDSFQNPVTQNLYYCSGTFPDPLNPSQKRIRIYVLPVPQVDFNFNQPVCVGQPVFFKDSSNAIYTHYRWNLSNGDSLVADSPLNTKAYQFNQAGSYQVFYTPSYRPLSGIPYCPDTITKTVQVVDVKAEFETDTIKSLKPVYYFNNTSLNAVLFSWDFGHPKSFGKNTATTYNSFHDYTGDTGYFKVCLTVVSPEGCVDSVCHTVYNDFYPYIFIPNVYTPDNNDGFNDAFDIPIKGEDFYDLIIYNRWGEVVFKGYRDGEGNDGINWNGKKFNTGEKCPSGTYYFIFEYHFPNDIRHTVKTGPVTLLRP